MDTFALLWRAPEINPLNHKARSIPFLNPVSTTYGRTFFFSWFGFMIAFWSWYAFPPLLADVIAGDIHMQQHEVANSNIIALTATLIVRLIAGPCCDRFGPRLTFAGCLLAGAVPTFLAGAVYNASGLYALRFFIGILGGSFVPCQVWTTGFFDKNVVGTANALAGGLGNLGGGITYFVMPAVYKGLVGDGLPSHKAWRVSFVVPGILIVFVAVCLVLLCEDTPTGKWSERHAATEESLRHHGVGQGGKEGSHEGDVVDIKGDLQDIPKPSPMSSRLGSTAEFEKSRAASPTNDNKEKKHTWNDAEAQQSAAPIYSSSTTSAQADLIQTPSLTSTLTTMFSLQTLVPAACYFCTFGAELSINSILGNYYTHNFPSLSLQATGNWAAMFGLLNGIARPLGGWLSDLAYRRSNNNLWAKKAVLHGYGIMTGVFLIIIGVLNPKDVSMMMGLVAALAVFLEGANGADFGLVPHVHPHANGVVSGFTGAMGNLGGIVFAVVFRYNGKEYGRVFYIIGAVVVAINVAVSWIRPVKRGA